MSTTRRTYQLPLRGGPFDGQTVEAQYTYIYLDWPVMNGGGAIHYERYVRMLHLDPALDWLDYVGPFEPPAPPEPEPWERHKIRTRRHRHVYR